MFFFIYLNNLSFLLLIIGFWGLIVVKGNLLMVLMAVEMIIFAISIRLVMTSSILDDLSGQIFSLFLFTVAAAESAVGLAILVVYFKLRGTMQNLYFSILKG